MEHVFDLLKVIDENVNIIYVSMNSKVLKSIVKVVNIEIPNIIRTFISDRYSFASVECPFC